jgi:UDP-N-acetylmuramyl tripeptide synthase
VIHDRSGSNLVRGISAAFAGECSLGGQPKGDIAVIEADEAAFPEVVRRTAPRLILLLNLFRDQLDRYGELDSIAGYWRQTLLSLSPKQTLVVNADDPMLAALPRVTNARVITFGLNDDRHVLDALPHAADSGSCPACGAALRYDRLFLSHLGDYTCPNCGFHRPALDFSAHGIELRGLDASGATFGTPAGPLTVSVGVPGLYNVYNALAATTAALTLGLSPSLAVAGLAAFHSAFGRIERVEFRGRWLVIVLIKNPVGFNEVLRMLALNGNREATPTLIVINDLDADGRDVSWLWDADVEVLANIPALFSTAGIRSADMAVRLKYAGVPTERIIPLGDLRGGLGAFVDSLLPGGTGFILPTYTAMLELRRILSERGVVSAFWKQ